MFRNTTFAATAVIVCLCSFQNSDAKEKPVTKFPAEVSWGRMEATAVLLKLTVTKLPENRTISIPRLNNRMKMLRLSGRNPGASRLTFKPQITTWEITFQKDSPTGATPIVFFHALEKIELATNPHIVKQSKDGSVTLPAHHVITHGKLLRYEPQPHKNTMGYWANADDWAEWHVGISQPTEFEVEVLQGCGKGQGGSTVEIEIAGSKVEFLQGCGKGQGGSTVEIEVAGSKVQFTIEDTGHFQNFKPRKIGTVRVAKSGEFQLKIRAIKKAKNAVCDIRQIRLLPVKK
jgi:hypothetical protein